MIKGVPAFNKVDKLLARIEKIQANCEARGHKFAFPEELKLYESKKPGVFIVDARHSRKMKCTSCSVEKSIYPTTTCSKCGDVMQIEQTDAPAKDYFPVYACRTATLSTCPGCKLRIASPNWNEDSLP